MSKLTFFTLAAVLLAPLATFPVSANDLAANFRNPPETTKPYCYWYWLNGDITADGITKDLEAMAKMGIRQAMIGNIEGGGPVKMFSPEWYTLTRHALSEAERVGVGIMMFNGPGWSQSGGPWIKPEQSMRRIDWSEIEAKEGKFSQVVRPSGKGQKIELDLGNVEVMAKVTLNGREFETLWMPPFALNVTDALKTGDNELAVLVTSTSQGKPKLGDVKLKTVSMGNVK